MCTRKCELSLKLIACTITKISAHLAGTLHRPGRGGNSIFTHHGCCMRLGRSSCCISHVLLQRCGAPCLLCLGNCASLQLLPQPPEAGLREIDRTTLS